VESTTAVPVAGAGRTNDGALFLAFPGKWRPIPEMEAEGEV